MLVSEHMMTLYTRRKKLHLNPYYVDGIKKMVPRYIFDHDKFVTFSLKPEPKIESINAEVAPTKEKEQDAVTSVGVQTDGVAVRELAGGLLRER